MPSSPPAPANVAESGRVRLAGVALAGAIVAAYVTSFWGVMVFDDLYAIVHNPLIRDPGRLDLILLPPVEGGPVAGRPIVNLTLALNHAISGTSPWSYHAVNLAIHVAASLVLFGLVRRTLAILWSAGLPAGRGPAEARPSRPDPLWIAFAITALWSLHPLQTESVTYVIQRAESLCGLFYLGTLYCFVRSADSPRPHRWQTGAFAACLLGMATKEVMVSAPLLVLLYDRTFLAGSWRDAWQRRWRVHASLMATWLLLAALVVSAEGRGGSAGFATTVGMWPYLLTQCQAIVHYLRLAAWPDPQVFDYGTPVVTSIGAVLPQAVFLVALLGGTLWALRRKPVAGFVGAWFFLILAPSSSLVPVATQTMAEHRMYLPLAAVVVAGFWLLQVLLGPYRAIVFALGLALAAGALTAARNCDYHSELALWSHTAAHRPQNPRAHSNLGIALAEAGRPGDAVAEFEEALRLQPGLAAAHLNLCDVLLRLDRPAEAVTHGEAAVRLAPESAAAHLNLGKALASLGRVDEAAEQYAAVLKIEPGAADAIGLLAGLHLDRGNEAARRGDFAAAAAAYGRAVAIAPDHLPARVNLGNALLVAGRIDEAIAQYREVLRRNPADARVQENLAQALQMKARP